MHAYMLVFLMLVVSAASFSGFYAHWAFWDGNGAIVSMIEGTAGRPFVHRQLLPQTAHFVREALPEKTQERLASHLAERPYLEQTYARAKIPADYIIEYHLIYLMAFGAFFAAIWCLRGLLTELLADRVAATCAALVFALVFPFFETGGGYYYDFPELLFFLLAVRWALHGKWLYLLFLTPLAEWNKEAFFFFLITLFPFHRARFGTRRALALTVGTVFVAGLAYLPVRAYFAGNPGGMTSFHLFDHLREVFKFSTYWGTELQYGFLFGKQVFLPHVLIILWIASHGWRDLSSMWRCHAGLVMIIAIPLYWLFCSPGELRNLSFFHPMLAVLLGYYLRDIVHRADAGEHFTKGPSL